MIRVNTWNPTARKCEQEVMPNRNRTIEQLDADCDSGQTAADRFTEALRMIATPERSATPLDPERGPGPSTRGTAGASRRSGTERE